MGGRASPHGALGRRTHLGHEGHRAADRRSRWCPLGADDPWWRRHRTGRPYSSGWRGCELHRADARCSSLEPSSDQRAAPQRRGPTRSSASRPPVGGHRHPGDPGPGSRPPSGVVSGRCHGGRLMEVIRIDASDLGNQAYLVTDGARAMVIDPPRPVGKVVDMVRSRGLQLEMVVDTHLHNDHVSGGPELAEATGAVYAVCADEHVRGARGIVDGDRFEIGALVVTVKATPGHTPLLHSSVVSEGEGGAVFPGGSLLIGPVGRTDLLGAGLAASLASAQWSSVRWMLDNLPDETGVHPTH